MELDFQFWTRLSVFFFFFFNDTATTEIYTLSLHDALPIFGNDTAFAVLLGNNDGSFRPPTIFAQGALATDRKSTRLNSSHITISYAVFCLKKKKQHQKQYVKRAEQMTNLETACQHQMPRYD